MREETRKQRYNKKINNSKSYPISLCAINFMVDDNLGFLVRSAGCFGVDQINVIGTVPHRRIISNSSGSLIDYIKINQFKNPTEFLTQMYNTNTKIICAELTKEATSIFDYKFNFSQPICLVVGNETSGIPQEILVASESIFIPMPGIGFCLNTAQAANIMLYETIKQYEGK